jgi:hypothetical protein
MTPWQEHLSIIEQEQNKPVKEVDFNTVVGNLARAINSLEEQLVSIRNQLDKHHDYLQLVMAKEEDSDHVRDPRDLSIMPEDQEERYIQHGEGWKGENGTPAGIGVGRRGDPQPKGYPTEVFNPNLDPNYHVGETSNGSPKKLDLKQTDYSGKDKKVKVQYTDGRAIPRGFC